MASEACNVLLAKKWTDKQDPKGWWMSEKLDGVRAYWSGSAFYSRSGNRYYAPKWFTKDLPTDALDGELWCGRGCFQRCVSIVRKQTPVDADWRFVTYLVFDAPKHGAKYEARVDWLNKNIKKSTHAEVVGVEKCKSTTHLNEQMDAVLARGGEGIMLRQPGSAYEHCRSGTLLKVKRFHDEEALVTGHKPHIHGGGKMGALFCELPNGVKFKVGTGFTDAQRYKAPKIGSVVSFKYQELSNSGTPRFPVYLRIRGDVTWEDVCRNAKTKPPPSQKPKVKVTLKKQHSILFSNPDTSATAIVGKKRKQSLDGNSDNASSEAKKAKIDDDDADEVDTRPWCKYGANCYQTNAQHLAQFRHPAPTDDEDEEEEEVSNVCQPGAADDAQEDDDLPAATTTFWTCQVCTAIFQSAPTFIQHLEGHLGFKPAAAKAQPAAQKAASVAVDAQEDVDSEEEVLKRGGKIPCKWGAECFRRSAKHRAEFWHPDPANKSEVVEAQATLTKALSCEGFDF